MLINSSCRRRQASSALNTMDPGLRRDDDEEIRQLFHNRLPMVWANFRDHH